MKSVVEGKMWVCSACDHTAVGFMGETLQPTHPPTQAELQGGVKNDKKKHRDEVLYHEDASPPTAAPVHAPPHDGNASAFNIVLASQAPLLSNSSQSAERLPCTPDFTMPTESPAKKRVRMEAGVQLASQSLQITPTRGTSAHSQAGQTPEAWLPGPEDVTFYLWTGREKDQVVWIAKNGGETQWDASARTIYFQPSTMLAGSPNTIMVRLMADTHLGYIMTYILKLWHEQGFSVEEPFMSFMGLEQSNTKSTAKFKGHNDTLLVEERQGDRFPVAHRGKLWCCTDCGHSNTRYTKIKEDHGSIHPKGIQMLNRDGLPIQACSWGGHKRIRDGGKVSFSPDPFSMFTFGRLPPPPVPVQALDQMESANHVMRDILVMCTDKQRQAQELPQPGPVGGQRQVLRPSVMLKKKPVSQVNQVAPTMTSMVDRGRPSRRDKAVYQKDYRNCELEDIENSSDDWSGSDDEELEEMEVDTSKVDKTRQIGNMNQLDKFLAKHCVESDEDEDDGSVLYQMKKERQAVRRQDMVQVLQAGLDTSKLYMLETVGDKEFVLELKGFINSKTHKLTDMRHAMTEETADKLEAGHDLTGLDRAAQAGTSKEYWFCLTRLLGIIQENKNTYSEGTLKDGKIRLEQYFMFNQKEHLRYDNPINLIEKAEGNMGIRSHMLSGWMMLGKLLVKKLEDGEYKAMFNDSSIFDPVERARASEDRAEQEQARILGKIAVMKSSEKFKEWERKRKSGATKAKLYRDDFQLQTDLTPVQILHR